MELLGSIKLMADIIIDKEIDVLDEVCSRVSMKETENVDKIKCLKIYV